MKSVIKAIIILSVSAIVAGCNTMSGVGQDIQDSSHAVSKMINGKKSSSNDSGE